MAVVPTVLSDWVPGPFVLHTKKCGMFAKFSGDNSVVKRKRFGEYSGGCVTYTANPLPLGQVWQTTILSTTRKWSVGLSVGVTTTLPDEAPDYLRINGASNNEWYYDGNTLYHNYSRTDYSHLPNLDDFKVDNKVGFLLLPNGEFHLFLDGKNSAQLATGLPVHKSLFGVVDVMGRCTKIKSEILSDPTEIALQAALQEGFIPHRDDKFLIHGPGGVGKSSLIAMFLGTQRDVIRISTPVATEPLHLTPIRDVSTSTFTADWQRVNYERLSRMIAHTSNQMFIHWKNKKKENKEKKRKDGGSQVSATAADEISSQATYLSPPKALQPSKKVDISALAGRFRSAVSKVFKKSLTTTLGDDPDNIEGFFTEFQQGLRDLMLESTELKELLMSHSIHLVDSGGQPQFHDIVSIFIPELSGLISVYKLNEYLGIHGEVALYEEGKLANDPYESHYTNEQVIRHDLQVIQSEATRCSIKEMPNLAFVGTFLDLQDSCPETPDEKDERLHAIITEILPENMQQSVITSGGQITFRINARNPTKQDFEKVDQLKRSLMDLSHAKSRNLPLKWHGYNVALHMLMEELKRYALSRKECEFIGHKLGFDFPSLNAALDYLRQLNIIAYYDVLPNVIFGSSQVILDKITELVRYSLKLKKGQSALNGGQRKFVQQGIVSLQFLRSPDVNKHYITELFQPEDLLKVLISQLVVSAVGAKEFIMPCVLEVSKIYPSPPVAKCSVRSSFILHFSKNSPMFGVFCCTISSLLSDAGWKLLTEDGEVVQVARNSFTFQMPSGFPGKLTFFDPISSYLEVILELPADLALKHCSTLYPEIRNTFLGAVKKAMKMLHYKVQVPNVSFMCPEKKCSRIPHPGLVEGSLGILKCSLKPGSIYASLTEEQKIWLPKAVGESQLRSTSVRSSPQPPSAHGIHSHSQPAEFPGPASSNGKEHPSLATSAEIHFSSGGQPEGDETHYSEYTSVKKPASSQLLESSASAIEYPSNQTGDKSELLKKPTPIRPSSMEPTSMTGEPPATEDRNESEKQPPTKWQPSIPVIDDTRSNPKKPPGNKPVLTSTSSTTAPSLQELYLLKIPQLVGVYYKMFGTFLLNDVTGSRVDSIEVECLRKPEIINTRILQEWLTGKGKPCTWQILIKTLRDCEFTVLAEQIEGRREYGNEP